jgi:hypothetical protein
VFGSVPRRVGPNDIMAAHAPEASMNIHIILGPLLSIIAGILILAVPRLLNYIVAIYLIFMGLIGLFGSNIFR